ncbi:phytanoyl-CoA dioxygenase family protein [Novosphingobium sp. G106]|uniref:phytanoyl-CoA dioxygenase family protein n=1 Tax=Novosphingobium sp. G106 TaxID=2849500 RepID=UPI001C2D687E|nr:phytanoyl-CoA dioxygenase family protein [Novosphingobium sp. G106]MBV1687852.1 phytanoyl-CoA dioxygenase family protein [Novosphingobium sp. G106]
MATTFQTAPSPTTSLEQGLADLASHGGCVIAEALDPALLSEIRTAVYRAAQNDQKYKWGDTYQYGNDDGINQRIWNLPSRDPVFCHLAELPLVLEIVKAALGWPALLSSMAANITGPGGSSMVIHADQGVLPEPWGWDRPMVLNIGFCIDDFTVTNGATRVAFGSHRHNRQPKAGDPMDLVSVEVPAGSAVVLDGRTWHTSGENRGTSRRAGIFSVYTLPTFMPQENWFLSLNPAVRQFGSETLQTLLGFRPQVMGRVNGRETL